MTNFGAIDHGNRNHWNRHKGSNAASAEEDMIDFLMKLGAEYGESHATSFIREGTTLGI